MEVGTTSPLAKARRRFTSSDSFSGSDSDSLLLFSEEAEDCSLEEELEEAVEEPESFLHAREGHVPDRTEEIAWPTMELSIQ